MRLMIVGSDKVYAIENLYAKYLSAEDADVRQFAAQSLFYDYYQRNILNKVLFKSGLSSILKDINRRFLEQVDVFRPDIVWIFKGMEIFPSTIAEVKRQYIRLVNYNPDNPFLFTGKGSGNGYVRDALPLYDLHLTYNLLVQKRLEEEYHIPTAMLPFGFDLSQQLFETCSRQQEVNRLCFLGNPDPQRAAFIDGLAGEGLSIDVYGNDWKSFVSRPEIDIFPAVFGEEFWKILRRYRVQLNLMRIHNEDSHNMRSFEIPGAGGIMLAPATTEHRIFFRDREEAFFFDDLRHCVRLANDLLLMDHSEAEKIRHNARQRSLQDGYSYSCRSRFVLDRFRNLCAS